MIKEEKGSVTIFFVYTIVLVMSLIFSITELARMNAERLYLQMASSVSVESMLSMYHRKLYEYYHIFALEMRDEEGLKNEYFDFLMPHFRENILGDERKINNWEIAHIDKDLIDINYKTILTDNSMEKEIIEYMKISLIGKVIEYLGNKKEIKDENDLSSFEDVFNKIIESHNKKSIYAEIHERYFNFSSSLKKLAKNADNLKNDIKEVNKYLKDTRGITTNGSVSSVNKVKNSIEKIKNKIDSVYVSINGYKEALSQYREEIEKSIDKYQSDLNSGKYDFNEETISFIDEEFETFISFSEGEDEILKKIEELEKSINVDKKEFNTFRYDLNNYQTELEILEDYKKELSRLKGDENDPAEMEAVNEEIKSLREEIRDYVKELINPYILDMYYEEIIFNLSQGETREEKAMEKILSFGNNMILKSVLTNEEYSSINNEKVSYKNFNLNGATSFLNKLLVNEYRLKDFNYYNKNLLNEETLSGSVRLEVEQILKGKNSDVENLDSVVKEIIAIRMAMNILHIYKTTELRERARNLSIATFGAISPVLQEVMFVFIITSWGICQSIKDVRKLLHNKRVPFIPTDESFDFNVSDIFRFGEGDTSMLDDDNESEDAFLNMNYKDYLRLLMLIDDNRKMNRNMASIIQKNMENVEETFDLNNMLYSFMSVNTFKSSHMLTEMLFLRPKDIELNDSYKIRIEAYSDYGNLK